MFRRIQSRRSREGFTLIELLIVVAIIGIIAVILIPNLLDALQKAKQKSTTADIREIMQAVFSYTTDQVGAAAAGDARTFSITEVGAEADAAAMNDLLVPADTSEGAIRYIQTIPENDGWGNPYEFYMNIPVNPLARSVFAMRSLGQDATEGCTACEDDTGASNPYDIGPFPANEYEQDIVGADGYFVRWPAGGQPGAVAPPAS